MRIVSREFLNDILDEYYKQQENFCSFCRKSNCCFRQRSYFFAEELRNRKFSTLNSGVLVWKITYMKKNPNIVTLRPVLTNENVD